MPPIVVIALFLLPAWWVMKRDFQKGFCVALCLFTLMPSTLALEAGGFELTFQRILLILVLAYWVPWVLRQPKVVIPFKKLMIAWWVANLFSLMFTVDFGGSLKWFLSFTTEIVLFYWMVATTLTTRQSLMWAFRALCVSAGIIAVLGTVEYYTSFNPVLDLLGVAEVKDPTDVIVTFRHRILFGYSMAMGWPLLLVLAHRAEGRLRKILMTVLVMLAIGSCYFSGSRGPWFGAALGGVVMYAFGAAEVRKSMRIFGYLSIVMIIVRPGVRDTLVDLCTSTWDPDSYRGRSYYYRKELWPVAKSLAATDGTRFLFGHGGLSTETMDLHDRFEYGGSTYHTGFSSWDNNYAADLVEFGYVGLGIECALYGVVLWTLYRSVKHCPPEDRNFMAAFIAGGVVYAFSLSNVFMFSPQLKCMYLIIVTLGVRFPQLVTEEEEESAEEPEAEAALGPHAMVAAKPT